MKKPKGPGQSSLLLLDAIEVLEGEDIDYAVIGAMAASVYGVIRASQDADAIVSLAFQEMSQLEGRFKNNGFQTELRRGDTDDPISALLVLSDKYGNRVDLIAGLRGLELEAFSRSIDVPFQGSSLRVIGLEDFVAMKVFAGGPVDIDDARRVIASCRERINLPMLLRLTERYGSAATVSLSRLLSN